MERLRSVMDSRVEFVRPNSTLREAAEKMKRMDVGALPVCEGERVVGMITDRDIVIRVLAVGLDPNSARASDVMTRDVVFCYEDQSLRDAAQIMQQRKVGRIVVLDQDHRLRGIVSLGRMSRHLGEEHFSDFIVERISSELPSQGLTRWGSRIGAVAGVAALVTGAYYLFQKPEGFERPSRFKEAA